MGILLYPYISRVLSIEGFGLVGFSMAYVLIFQVIVDYGFNISTTEKVARHRENKYKLSSIISETVATKLILCTVSIVIFFISSTMIEAIKENFLITLSFVLSSLTAALLPDFYYRGIEKMKILAIRTVIIKTLALLFIILLVDGDSDIIYIPLSFLFCNFLATFITYAAMHREGIRPTKVSLVAIFKCLGEGFLFFLSRISVSINQSLGAFFLGMKFTPSSRELGLFTGASRLSISSEMMLPPITDSIYPHMINKKDYKLFKDILLKGTTVWFIACGVVAVFAPQICSIILGPGYEQSASYLRILLIGNFLAFPNMMMGYNALSPIGLAKHANFAIIFTSIINIILLSTLHLLDLITIYNVCVVIALTNLISLTYRSSVFLMKYRTLQPKS